MYVCLLGERFEGIHVACRQTYTMAHTPPSIDEPPNHTPRRCPRDASLKESSSVRSQVALRGFRKHPRKSMSLLPRDSSEWFDLLATICGQSPRDFLAKDAHRPCAVFLPNSIRRIVGMHKHSRSLTRAHGPHTSSGGFHDMVYCLNFSVNLIPIGIGVGSGGGRSLIRILIT